TAERNGFLYDFVDAYNRTRLKAIGYIAPKQALDNQTELYTKAGTSVLRCISKQRFPLSRE
ncbi:MAG TPA: hypothetical protein VN155_18115, partial [Devosia sp.]|nr:hypothetical protein [Devosia sp.]